MTKQSIQQLQGIALKDRLSGNGFETQPVENIVRPESQPRDIPTFQGFGKGFKIALDDNSLVATTGYFQDEGFSPQKIDPNYDPFKDIPKDKLDFIDNYKSANSPEEVARISGRIDHELENRRIMSEEVGTGAALASGLLAGILDPINLIPIGGEAYKGWKVGKVAQGALRTGTAGLASGVASEAILQGTQETRTAEESAVNIAASTVLSGVLGGASSALTKESFGNLTKKFSKDIHNEKADFEIDPQTQELKPTNFDSSVGAKRVVPYEQLYLEHVDEANKAGKQPLDYKDFQNQMESLSAGVGGSAKLVAKSLSQTNPLLRTFNSQSVEAKSLLQDLATHNMIVGKNELGVASQQSVETAIKQWRAGLGEALPANNDAFKAFKKRAQEQGIETPIKNQVDFNTEVSKALRRGDVSEIPEVEQAAKIYRAKVFDPLKNAAIENKILPEDVEPQTAVSYLSRLWNRKAVVAQEPELRKIIETKLRDVELPKVKSAFAKREEILISQINDLRTRQAELDHSLQPSKKKLLQEAKGELQKISDEELFGLLDKYKEANKILAENKPKSLFQFIKENGGIHDARGELASRDITNKRFIGLIRKQPFFEKRDLSGVHKVGVTFDDVALRAWEHGYFPELQQRPTINDLLDAIDQEARGNKIYSEHDLEALQARDYAKGFFDELSQNGIDINKIKEAKNFKELNHLTQKTTTKTITPVNLLESKTKIKTTSKSIPELLIGTELKAIEAKIKRLDARFNEAQQKFRGAIGDVGEEHLYINEIVDSILANLKGESRFNATSNYDFKITKRGPLKERTLSFIKDVEVEKFLENDVEAIADRYTKIMGTDVELARKFDGDVNLQSRLEDVRLEYEDLASKAKTTEERTKIQKEKEHVLRDLQALRDIQRGIYGQPDNPDSLIVRGFRVGRQLNYATRLGGVVVSSLNDALNTVGIHGFKRFFKGLSHVASNLKGVKLNVQEAKRAGNILENVLHTRLATLAELTDPLNTGQSTFERFTANVARLGTKLNGITLWNDVMKGFSSVVTQQRLIEEVQNLSKGTIKKTDRTYLAFLGIDEGNVNQILRQVDKFAEKESDLWVANTEKWTDADAVRLYRNALNQDVDRTIVTKTAGDVPLFMNSEIGKTIGQFKSFTFASTQQVLIARLQQADAAALNGFIASVSAGMLIYYLKTLAAGKEPSEDPAKWVVEGIDRSGVLGIVMEANNISEKLTRGKVGINGLIGGEVMSKYASRGIVDTLAGPTAGQMKDIATITAAISTGEIKESDVKAFRRMIPYQNTFYLNGLFNQLEQGLNKNLGTAQ